jgi:hypothetical protein
MKKTEGVIYLYMKGYYWATGPSSSVWTSVAEAGNWVPSPAPTKYYYVTSHTWAYTSSTHKVIRVTYNGYIVANGIAYTAILYIPVDYDVASS